MSPIFYFDRGGLDHFRRYHGPVVHVRGNVDDGPPGPTRKIEADMTPCPPMPSVPCIAPVDVSSDVKSGVNSLRDDHLLSAGFAHSTFCYRHTRPQPGVCTFIR